ncbi:single-stranded DNA-binding protein [Mucilaginibacter sp. UYCu711]|uniref:single-stranded DNA-binding protein n=1 Tax=Mucilaginibacter sp. UYCu711 TaxID=3156339 RepID=UPI003D22B18D
MAGFFIPVFSVNLSYNYPEYDMYGINKAILIGHIGKDPELRYLDNAVAVLSFPLATTESIVKEESKIEQTEWHNIVMWRTMAENAGRLLKKGSLVWVEGKVKTRSFNDKNGIQKSSTEIHCERFTLLSTANIPKPVESM